MRIDSSGLIVRSTQSHHAAPRTGSSSGLPPLAYLDLGDSQHTLADDEEATPVFEAPPGEGSSFLLLEEELPSQVVQERKAAVAAVDAVAKGLLATSDLPRPRSLHAKLGMLDRAIALHHGSLIVFLTLFLRSTISSTLFLFHLRMRPVALSHIISFYKQTKKLNELEELYVWGLLLFAPIIHTHTRTHARTHPPSSLSGFAHSGAMPSGCLLSTRTRLQQAVMARMHLQNERSVSAMSSTRHSAQRTCHRSSSPP
jgi:hypothetical protein